MVPGIRAGPPAPVCGCGGRHHCGKPPYTDDRTQTVQGNSTHDCISSLFCVCTVCLCVEQSLYTCTWSSLIDY